MMERSSGGANKDAAQVQEVLLSNQCHNWLLGFWWLGQVVSKDVMLHITKAVALCNKNAGLKIRVQAQRPVAKAAAEQPPVSRIGRPAVTMVNDMGLSEVQSLNTCVHQSS